MTRILNGCAEARTVGTHYSTTHPPPLSQNSTSSYCSFSPSLSLLPPSTSVPRVSLFLSPSHPGPPWPPLLGGWFFRLAPRFGPPLDPSPFLSAHPARHGEAVFVHTAHVLVALVCLSHVYTYKRARATHSCSILFSFHLSFYPTPFLRRSLFSSSSSSSFLREA